MAVVAVRGRFVWFDLMTSDVEAAQKFYTSLIGWGTEEWKGSDQPYTMWTNQGTPMGGVMTLSDDAKKAGAPPHWLGYIATPDVDETVAKATELGGQTYVPATEIPDTGRFAMLGDPQGAVFAVFSHGDEPPSRDGPPSVGEMSWHELMTAHYEKAFEFYSTLFGWEKTDSMDMGEAGIYQMFGLSSDGPPMGGMFNKPPEMPAAAWLYYTVVNDVKQSVEEVKKMGGQVLNGPMQVPGESGDWVAQCVDPQGAAFALHSTGS